MVSLVELDDPVYDSILSHLTYLDLFLLSTTCRAMRSIVQQSSLKTLNCTRSYTLPINRLPYTADAKLLRPRDWRSLTLKSGFRREYYYLTQLYWTSRHKHFNLLSLRNVALDSTRVNILDIIHFLNSAPHLRYLSVRFCENVDRVLLQNYLDSLVETRQSVSLERLDCIGISGIPFFEPPNSYTITFDEAEIDLISVGRLEYTYWEIWHESVEDFRMSLERVPTRHGATIKTDVARCSQAYCRIWILPRLELADPTAKYTLPPCYLCGKVWIEPICRLCIVARSCGICRTFICPRCYNIDEDEELYELSTECRWRSSTSTNLTATDRLCQSMASELARGGDETRRDCAIDMKAETGPGDGSARACLVIQRIHYLMSRLAAAERKIEDGWIPSGWSLVDQDAWLRHIRSRNFPI